MQARTSTLLRIASTAALAAGLGGCIITSPYWNEEFASKATAVPLQAFTTNKDLAVKFECSQAYHGGLYPFGGPEVWVQVASVMPSQQPLFDPQGGKVYGAGSSLVLPAACWHADAAYNPPLHYSAIRASQTSPSGGVSSFTYTYDKPGLGCLGQATGSHANWFAAGVSSCAQKYSNSSTPIPFVIFRALN